MDKSIFFRYLNFYTNKLLNAIGLIVFIYFLFVYIVFFAIFIDKYNELKQKNSVVDFVKIGAAAPFMLPCWYIGDKINKDIVLNISIIDLNKTKE